MTDHPTATRYTGRNTPALDRLRCIAWQLGPLTERVVFIGGAVAPLLQTDDVLPRVRPTHDVDAVIATSSYAELGPLREALSARGFSEAQVPQEQDAPLHMHRWIAPAGGRPFDLVPIGAHAGGTGGVPDTYAVESAVSVDLRESDTAAPWSCSTSASRRSSCSSGRRTATAGNTHPSSATTSKTSSRWWPRGRPWWGSVAPPPDTSSNLWRNTVAGSSPTPTRPRS